MATQDHRDPVVRKLDPDYSFLYTYEAFQAKFKDEYTQEQIDLFWEDNMIDRGDPLDGDGPFHWAAEKGETGSINTIMKAGYVMAPRTCRTVRCSLLR